MTESVTVSTIFVSKREVSGFLERKDGFVTIILKQLTVSIKPVIEYLKRIDTYNYKIRKSYIRDFNRKCQIVQLQQLSKYRKI